MMEAQADVQLKYIMKANSDLDYYTALVNKKSQFSDEINKYQYLDGIGLFDGKNELYIGVKGNSQEEADKMLEELENNI